MSRTQKSFRFDWTRILILGLLAIGAFMGFMGEAIAASSGDKGHGDDHAEASAEPSGELLVADSVCEAHELRFMQKQDSSLRIEIPAQYAGQ